MKSGAGSHYPSARIAIFLREPVPGETKTRLIPALGADGAAALYRAMAERITGGIAHAGLAEIALWVSSNPHNEWFLTLCNKTKIYLQQGNELGQRMEHCVTAMLSQAAVESVVLVGSDCPVLGPEYLQAALDHLDTGADVVFGPAEDGGYVLLGLRRVIPELFRNIEWGTERVLKQSLAQLRPLGLRVECLEELWDVDTAADLPRLSTLEPPLEPPLVWG